MNFNPRSLVGNDVFYKDYSENDKGISIHVPSWGTTSGNQRSYSIEGNFNPRSLVGNDAVDDGYAFVKNDFNPRSLVGNDERRYKTWH